MKTFTQFQCYTELKSLTISDYDKKTPNFVYITRNIGCFLGFQKKCLDKGNVIVYTISNKNLLSYYK